MRQIFLDTETTGLLPEEGHRVIEIGCIEMVNRRVTGNNLHLYLNPERDIDVAASEIHGITLDQLQDKPRFADIATQFLEFVAGAEIIIHNAAFDMGFLESELSKTNRQPLRPQLANVVDTYQMAKVLHPGKRKSLDALCERYGISNAHRTHHGALLDAGLLAEVFLAMTQGQETLEISVETHLPNGANVKHWPPRLFRVYASTEELLLHETALDMIAKESKQVPLWRLSPLLLRC